MDKPRLLETNFTSVTTHRLRAYMTKFLIPNAGLSLEVFRRGKSDPYQPYINIYDPYVRSKDLNVSDTLLRTSFALHPTLSQIFLFGNLNPLTRETLLDASKILFEVIPNLSTIDFCHGQLVIHFGLLLNSSEPEDIVDLESLIRGTRMQAIIDQDKIAWGSNKNFREQEDK
jgi:hypothetical protein